MDTTTDLGPFDKRLTLDLTTSDHKALKSLAAAYGVSMADLLRNAVRTIIRYPEFAAPRFVDMVESDGRLAAALQAMAEPAAHPVTPAPALPSIPAPNQCGSVLVDSDGAWNCVLFLGHGDGLEHTDGSHLSWSDEDESYRLEVGQRKRTPST